MSAILNAIVFDEDTQETLIKIMSINSAQELEMTMTMIDLLADLDNVAIEITGLPDGDYALVVQADLAKNKDILLHLYNTDTQAIIALGAVNTDVIAHSALFYRESFTKAQDDFDASRQDDAAEEQYENDLRAISALRSHDFKEILAPYIIDQPEFFYELQQALDLLTIDYIKNLLAIQPHENLTVYDTGASAPPRRVPN